METLASHVLVIDRWSYYNGKMDHPLDRVFDNRTQEEQFRDIDLKAETSCVPANNYEPHGPLEIPKPKKGIIESYGGLGIEYLEHEAFMIYAKPKGNDVVSYVNLIKPFSDNYDDPGVSIKIDPYVLFTDDRGRHELNINVTYKLKIACPKGTKLYKEVKEFVSRRY